MSAFYGTVTGNAKTEATRRGHNEIKVSAQSWNGSVITRLYYNGDNLNVELQISDDSSIHGYTYFNGTIEELKNKLKGENNA